DHRGLMESSASGQGRPGQNPALREQARETQKGPPRDGAPRLENERSGSPGKANEVRSGVRGDASWSLDDPRAAAREARWSPETAQKSAVEKPGLEGARMARLGEIERRPFGAYTDLEYDQAREVLKPLERRFRIRLGRRLRMARRGRIDFRRTIRAGIQRGGLLAELKSRARRPRHVDLLILADISGSVRYAAELLLELVAGARDCFRRVRSFVYIDRLAEAEFEQGH